MGKITEYQKKTIEIEDRRKYNSWGNCKIPQNEKQERFWQWWDNEREVHKKQKELQRLYEKADKMEEEMFQWVNIK